MTTSGGSLGGRLDIDLFTPFCNSIARRRSEMPISFVCPYCGRTTSVSDEFAGQSGPCVGCGRTISIPMPGFPPRTEDLGQNAGIRMLLPVGRSFWAIAAGYMGLCSVILLPAPFAIILGIIAIIDIRKHPEKHGMGRAIFGIVMGLLCPILFFAFIYAVSQNPGVHR
jgi:hypothetical protein